MVIAESLIHLCMAAKIKKIQFYQEYSLCYSLSKVNILTLETAVLTCQKAKNKQQEYKSIMKLVRNLFSIHLKHPFVDLFLTKNNL